MLMVLIPWTFIQHPLLHRISRLINLDSTEKRGVISSFKATFSTVYQLRCGPSSGYTSPSQCGRLQTCHFKWQQVIWILFPSKILLYIQYVGVLSLGEDVFSPNKHLFYCISTKKKRHLLTPFFFSKKHHFGWRDDPWRILSGAGG